MSEQFPSERDEIKRVVAKRLCVVEDQPLSESEMGPTPFQDEPLERWLFEGYLRAYSLEPIQHQAFWEGVAEALFTLMPLDSAQHLEPLLRCTRLVDRIGLRLTAEALQQDVLHKRAVLSAHVSDSLGFSIDQQTLALQTMVRIAMWLSPSQRWTAQWDATLQALIAHAQSHWDDLTEMRRTELVSLASQTYALWGRRDAPMQAQMMLWKKSINTELLEIYQATMDDFFKRTQIPISPNVNWRLIDRNSTELHIEEVPPRLHTEAANLPRAREPLAA